MRVAIIGAGTMGRGIAQLCASQQHLVAVTDVAASQLEDAIRVVELRFDRLAEKGEISADQAREHMGRLRMTTDFQAAVADADVAIECVVESLDVKHSIMEQLTTHAPRSCLMATNTSQLPISGIAGAVPDDAHRVVGMHFFNPAPIMGLVEVIAGLGTSEQTVSRAVSFAKSLGKETVVCRKDSPGFITSRVSAIVRLECLRMLEEGVASASDIDKAVRLGLNFPMGPLELGDLNGLDTYLLILESLEATLGERFRPTFTLRNLVSAGRLGRKTGLGVYRYDADGTQREVDL